ncbi:ribosome maturation factor RimM [Oenococcus oeni]|uniref:ribosome maturation factor RimM n=1 Tax=Oenococcus oeni TaxID=1247 RepID=UPI000277B250|nr:ribosome maturation factor RimM [Oenococcus oeni]EJO00174.1 16S rRNA processing protein RimM [Oenococcus oeni AWRIB418]KDE87225.1 ribosome maturation factor RimM [Oenococcus oeni]KEP88335.1 ribosome maturation factor RimM [Oenococcus oeni IOEB_0501]KGH59285.1 ribosome maturation factor RimM [Oenococcus oeni IOEB_9805]KGH61910.1 ribosome maturation factor RimM [Oenococcus oeni S13]
MKELRIGRIINTHGIAGELKIDFNTDFPEQRFAKNSELLIAGEKLVVQSSRPFKQFWLVKFSDHENINLVEKYKGEDIFINERKEPRLSEGEFLVSQIIGLKVIDEKGNSIGKIADSFHTGANDVWTIKKSNGKEILIPYIDQVVKKVDLQTSTVTIELLEGLDED